MNLKELDAWIEGYQKACKEIKSIMNDARLKIPDMEAKRIMDNLWHYIDQMSEKAHMGAPTVEIEAPAPDDSNNEEPGPHEQCDPEHSPPASA